MKAIVIGKLGNKAFIFETAWNHYYINLLQNIAFYEKYHVVIVFYLRDKDGFAERDIWISVIFFIGKMSKNDGSKYIFMADFQKSYSKNLLNSNSISECISKIKNICFTAFTNKSNKNAI